MTAGHEDARGADGAGRAESAGQRGERHGERGERRGSGAPRESGEYDGMDALMAAVTGDPLPEEARRDPAFLAAHRAAEADVAVLRDQLVRLAEALTGEAGTGEAAGAPTGEAGTGEAAGALTGEAGTGEAAGALTGEAGTGEAAGAPRDPVPAPPSARRTRGRTRPSAPTRPGRPGRPDGPRRALRIALGSLAGAAAFCLVLGFGWLLAQGGGPGGANDESGASSAKGNADATGQEAGAGGRPAYPERELACSRLVVEGTVARVERAGDVPGSRVTLTVIRSYRPAHGPAEVRFLLGAGARPAPRAGQHVLVRVGQDERYAGLWAVGERRVAAARGWITDALPGSRDLACPSGDGP
ncbi:hypothetical protein [Streptomyces spinosus]|uniref:hypothetical protein n=1 Tax=Streptomyces spinosus TaxID=2872623 RepID=UPI001CECE346|nr:hypothetical protein [Streptomyces spinosus]